MELAVLNTKGAKTKKTVKLDDAIFGIEPNDHVIYLDVKLILANGRQGTHKAKERAEITGSTRKIKKQKGTGTARAGSIKNPLFVGGGRVFGPRPRNYGFKLNKKQRVLARKSALSYKAKEDALMILEDLKFDTPKTKEYINILENLKVNNERTLVVVSEVKKDIYLSSRNVPNTKVISADQLNTYDVMNAGKVILEEGSIERINNLLK